MGSYGLGPARIVAASIEQRADEKGIVWPRSLAPWDVHLVSLAKAGEPEREPADRLYEELREAGLEVLYDDRDAGPGEKLTDAELLGCPLRLVVGRRGLADGIVEAQERASGAEHRLPVAEAAASAKRPARRDRLSRAPPRSGQGRVRKLFGLDRTGPEPRQTRKGEPLRPLTLPNLVGYVRLGGDPALPLPRLRLRRRPQRGCGAGLPGDLARRLRRRLPRPGDRPVQPHGRDPRPGGRPPDDPLRRRRLLAFRAPAALGAGGCWSARELVTLGLAQYGLRHGIDIEVNWLGRVAVFPIMAAIFFSMLFGGWLPTTRC